MFFPSVRYQTSTETLLQVRKGWEGGSVLQKEPLKTKVVELDEEHTRNMKSK